MNAEPASTDISARTIELLADATVWDNHACMPVRPGDVEFLHQLERHRQSGASFVSLNVSFDQFPWHFGFKMLATFRSWIKRHPERYLLVNKVGDIHRAKREGKAGRRLRPRRCGGGGRSARACRTLLRTRCPLDADRLQPQQPRRRRLPGRRCGAHRIRAARDRRDGAGRHGALLQPHRLPHRTGKRSSIRAIP